jgi:hypothetical protein
VSKARMRTNAHALAHPWRGEHARWYPPHPRTDPLRTHTRGKERTGGASYRSRRYHRLRQKWSERGRRRTPSRSQCQPHAAQRRRAAGLIGSRGRWMGGRTDAAQPQSTWPAQMMHSLHRSSSNTVSTTSSCAGEQGSGGFSWSARGIQHVRQAIPDQGGRVG